MIRLAGGAHSDVGRVRTNNQDAALAETTSAVYAVADGMGGHRGGEVASALVLEALVNQLASVRVGGGPLDGVQRVLDAVVGANEAVFEEARGNVELFGMGTTLCVLALIGAPGQEQLAVVNVGDSRIYLLHEGELSQLTEDHSLVQGLVRDGQLTAEEAAVHPNRNILTRVIGVEPAVEVDWWERPALVRDRYLLCSDGLFNEVSDARIAATLRQLADPVEAARTLVSLANAGGGRDNVTCVVVDVLEDDGGAGVPMLADPGATAAATLAASLNDPPPLPEPRQRRFTFRVLAFVAMLAILVAVAGLAIRTWARNSYFVAATGDKVAIYRGRPDGVLWFDPEVVTITEHVMSQLTVRQRFQVDGRHTTSSVREATQWLDKLVTSAATTVAPVSRPTTTTTVSTAIVPTIIVPTTTVPGTPVPTPVSTTGLAETPITAAAG